MTAAAISAAFATQAAACDNLGSPFMGRLMRLCATQGWPDGAVTDRIYGWSGDLGPSGQSVPLRLAGALHALHLQGNATLAQVYPPRCTDDVTLWAAVAKVLVSEEAAILRWLDSPPQTNEVRRSAPLIALGHWLADRYALPLRCSELGASAGLNLHWDDYALEIGGQHFGPATPALTLAPDWTGPLPPAARPQVSARAGVDLNPLDPRDPDDTLRLQAYLWPDQPDRLALTQAAMANARTPIAKGDAIDWLSNRLDHHAGQTHLVYTTIAWQYFPAAVQAQGAAMIHAAGQTARKDAPLAWFGMEPDGAGPGAALTLRLWPGDLTFALGRADFHGRWVHWTPDQTTKKD
ncbi:MULTISPECIES: DUF2332 domain-containing protein [unclassified Yoonia]|uniref:DUF2332 domain-containing protein n=1 Tax=unclassified Yoonia TaxID=2629118 RepID=UPI002AFE917F|nr:MULTISPECIES: DUF2332 family protein [unclassified Yoonia]